MWAVSKKAPAALGGPGLGGAICLEVQAAVQEEIIVCVARNVPRQFEIRTVRRPKIRTKGSELGQHRPIGTGPFPYPLVPFEITAFGPLLALFCSLSCTKLVKNSR